MPTPGLRLRRVSLRFPVAIVAAAWWVALWATVGATLPVAAGSDLALEKYVASVNEQAPAAGEAVSATEGDTVVYGLAVTSSAELAGTEVTVTDVFGANQLEFQNASVAACTESADSISCTVTLDDAGATEVTLTFSVLPLEDGTEECSTLANQARVENADGSTATSETQIQVCPPGSTTAAGEAPAAEASAPASPAAPAPAAGSTAPAASTPPSGGEAGGAAGVTGTNGNTAVSLPSGAPSALLIQLGLLLLAASVLVLGHLPAVSARSSRPPR